MNSTLLYSKSLNSVIDDGDLRLAFSRVLNYFDPHKSHNYKPRLLDCSISPIWLEQNIHLYNVDRTRNLSGSVSKKKFDIIVYEPPRNNKFIKETEKSVNTFKEILNTNGIVIVKINDFKLKGSEELLGSFNVWKVFVENLFYLSDNIVYNFHRSSLPNESLDRTEITHSYFMVFKMK
jgi:hypothetical protein